jgi:hypothetical protein
VLRAGCVYLAGYVLFFPLVAFIAYATWNGPPSGERWVEAYKIASVLAAIQFLVALLLPRPANRLLLGANLYLLIGGVLASRGAGEGLKLYGVLQESALMLCIVAVGLLSTVASAAGFVGVENPDRTAVRSASVFVLVVAAALTAFSYLLRGSRFLAAGLPILVLSLLQRRMARRLAPAPPSHSL